MKLQNKLVLLSSLFATSGLVGCSSGFHTFNHVHEENSLQNCGTHGNTCSISIPGWKSGTCTNAVCIATECIEGYHIYQNTCEPNEISTCGSHDNDCTVTQYGWKTGVCKNGTCQALTCIENMHTEEGLCVADDAEHCGTTQINCIQTVPAWSTGDCIEGKCQVATCADGNHLDTDKCEADTNTCCGNDCTNCENHNNWCLHGECVPKITCAPPRTTCDEKCVNTNDTNLCGDCDTDCNTNKPEHADDMFCDSNQCAIWTCLTGYLLKEGRCVACEEVEGYANCDGVCINVQKDVNNCGTCNKKCDTDQTCGNGKCLGNTFCSGMTYNTATSLDACGECGNRCPDGKTCIDGACVIGNDLLCKDSQYVPRYIRTSLLCDDKNVFPNIDSSHCGGCGNECGKGKYCKDGVCTNEAARSTIDTYCDGELVYPYNNSSHCGGCGNDCGKGNYCKAGVCTNEAPSKSITTYCDGELVYPYKDSSHCGGCGNDCGSKKCLNNTCDIYTKGDIITFGHYEQDNDTTNGKEPIAWRVLDKNSSVNTSSSVKIHSM